MSGAVQVTKRKEGRGKYGVLWRVYFNGKPTPFRISKSVAPRYGLPQMWDVIDGHDEDIGVMFDATSLEGAMGALRRVAGAAVQS